MLLTHYRALWLILIFALSAAHIVELWCRRAPDIPCLNQVRAIVPERTCVRSAARLHILTSAARALLNTATYHHDRYRLNNRMPPVVHSGGSFSSHTA